MTSSLTNPTVSSKSLSFIFPLQPVTMWTVLLPDSTPFIFLNYIVSYDFLLHMILSIMLSLASRGHWRDRRFSTCLHCAFLSSCFCAAWLECGILSGAHLHWVLSFGSIPTGRFQMSSTGNLAGFPQILKSLQEDNSHWPPSKYPFQLPS